MSMRMKTPSPTAFALALGLLSTPFSVVSAEEAASVKATGATTGGMDAMQEMKPGMMPMSGVGAKGGMMEHGSMGMDGMMQGNDRTGTGAEGTGVINSVDASEGVVNITHGPIASLSWPEMTIDLPVTDDVDLAGVALGDEVRFRVELGADKVYRMTAIEAAP